MPNHLYRRAKLTERSKFRSAALPKPRKRLAATHKYCRTCWQAFENKPENFALTRTGRVGNQCVQCFKRQEEAKRPKKTIASLSMCPVCVRDAAVHYVRIPPGAPPVAMCKRCMLSVALLEHLDAEGVDRIAVLAKERITARAAHAAGEGYHAFMARKNP